MALDANTAATSNTGLQDPIQKADGMPFERELERGEEHRFDEALMPLIVILLV